VFPHPVFHHQAELGHLEQGCFADPLGLQVGFDLAHLRLHPRFLVAQPGGLAEYLGEVHALHRDARLLQQLLAVTNGDKRRWPCPHLAKTRPAHPFDHPANGAKPLQVLAKARRLWINRVQRRQRVGNAILREVIAGRHLAAKAVATRLDRHLADLVGKSLHQHGHVEVGQSDRVGNASLLAKVGQCDEDAIDLFSVRLEQRCALF